MPRSILLYGADEYLGGLLLAEAVAAWARPGGMPKHRLLIGGRHRERMQALGQHYGLMTRTLDLARLDLLVQQLDGVQVLVNAASPFGETAVVLARAAMRVPCHVIDLNPEVDVFVALGRLGTSAEAAQCALVRSAGPGSAASALMVKAALGQLQADGRLDDHCLGAIRIGIECVQNFSRGSATSVLRALARDVAVVRAESVPLPGGGPGEMRMCLDHEPIGLLERPFDFSVRVGGKAVPPDRRIATAANLVDTLACSEELKPGNNLAGTVESYVSADTFSRWAYQAGAGALALSSPLAAAVFGSDTLLNSGASVLAGGPVEAPGLMRHTIVLDIEDQERTRLIDWRLRTPDFYLAGARAALAVTESVAEQPLAGNGFGGLKRASDMLADSDLSAAAPKYGRALRECVLDRRPLP